MQKVYDTQNNNNTQQEESSNEIMFNPKAKTQNLE